MASVKIPLAKLGCVTMVNQKESGNTVWLYKHGKDGSDAGSSQPFSDTLILKNQRMGQIAFCPQFLGFLI